MNKILKCFTVLFAVCLMASSVISVSAATYLIGDVDDDEDVTVIDATIALRVAAEMMTDPDGMMTLRGDVDNDGELGAVDATLILRYNAEMKVNVPIGEYREYPTEEPTEAVTEAPTAAPTTAPTVQPTLRPDPYELPPV